MKTSKFLLILLLLALNIQNANSQTSSIIDTEQDLIGSTYAISRSNLPKSKDKNSEYYLALAKAYLQAYNNPYQYKNALINLRNSLLLEKNNSEAFNLQSQTNYDFAIKSLEEGERELKNGYWSEGYFFYRALEHFSNAYLNEFKKEDILSHIDKINLLAKNSDHDFKAFNESNLFKISTAFQEKNTADYKDLKNVYSEKKANPNADKNELLDILKKLEEYAEYYFDNSKFQYHISKDLQIEEAKLKIELGDTDNACSLLYKTDMLFFHNNGYTKNACKTWYDKFSKAEQTRYTLEIKAAVKKWRTEHPNIIKLRSLIGENDDIVQSYLGLPVAKNFKINVGSGINKKEYAANKYKTKDGIYEIVLKDGKAFRIQFAPTAFIKFDTEAFREKKTNFDLEIINKPTSCFGDYNESFVGKTKIYSMDYTCEDYHSSIQFYGLNGKIISVVVY